MLEKAMLSNGKNKHFDALVEGLDMFSNEGARGVYSFSSPKIAHLPTPSGKKVAFVSKIMFEKVPGCELSVGGVVLSCVLWLCCVVLWLLWLCCGVYFGCVVLWCVLLCCVVL